MDVLIEAGGSIHRVNENFASYLAMNLRAFSNDSETAISAADKLERVLVEGQSEPLTFTPYEASTVAECVDHMGHKDSAPEELALFWALRGHLPGA